MTLTIASAWHPDPVFDDLTPGQLLAALLFGEARGETLEGMLAVASVVRTRVLVTAQSLAHRKSAQGYDAPLIQIQDVWHHVMLKAGAFPCFDAARSLSNAKKTVDTATQLRDGPPHLFPLQLRQLLWVASGTLDDAFPDPTHSATHYVVRNAPLPRWAQGRSPVAQVDSHDFYRLSDKRYD